MADVMNGQVRDEAELSAADEQVLRELTERARSGGLQLTGAGGLLGKLTKMKTDCKWIKGKGGTHSFWNLHTIKVCAKQSGTNSTFYGEGNAKVEEDGKEYWAPAGFPEEYIPGSKWTADNCWTNSPLHPPS